MKKNVFAVLAIVAFANAQTLWESLSCNASSSAESVCAVDLAEFSFGQNFERSGTNMFFLEAGKFFVSKSALPASAAVPVVNTLPPNLNIRFFIMSGNAGYNSAMSLVHTAYASKATLAVMFKNPVVHLFKDETDFKAAQGNAATSQDCYVVYSAGVPSHINCPILSLTLREN